MVAELEIIAITSHDNHDDQALLDEFHAGIYWDAFAEQHEPIAVWKRALWSGTAPYALTIRIAGRALRDRARREILGGIAFEHYPRSGCGLVTYTVTAPAARRQGLGRRLHEAAVKSLFAAGARIVFGELADPRVDAPAPTAWRRIEFHQASGARVLDLRYVQPALAPGTRAQPRAVPDRESGRATVAGGAARRRRTRVHRRAVHGHRRWRSGAAADRCARAGRARRAATLNGRSAHRTVQ